MKRHVITVSASHSRGFVMELPTVQTDRMKITAPAVCTDSNFLFHISKDESNKLVASIEALRGLWSQSWRIVWSSQNLVDSSSYNINYTYVSSYNINYTYVPIVKWWCAELAPDSTVFCARWYLATRLNLLNFGIYTNSHFLYLFLLFYRVWRWFLVSILVNVPSKLCACARAHKPWDKSTQEHLERA